MSGVGVGCQLFSTLTTVCCPDSCFVPVSLLNVVDYSGRLYAVNGPASSDNVHSVMQASIIDIDSGNVTYSWQPKSSVCTECCLVIVHVVTLHTVVFLKFMLIS